MQEGQGAAVALEVAASLVYFQVSRSRASMSGRDLRRALDDAAMSLSQVSDIYYENDRGHVLRIPDEEMQGGAFEEGARTFRSAAGCAYGGLSMRRIDVMYATEVLEKACRTLDALTPGASSLPA